MSTEVWAIVGVVVGAILGGSAQIAHSVLQRRWAEHDAKRARAQEEQDRLFDYKRDAHLAYLDVLARAETMLALHVGGQGELDPVLLDEAGTTQIAVTIYGSHEVADVSNAVAKIFNELTAAGDLEEFWKAHEAFVNIRNAYINYLRVDLGIDTVLNEERLLRELGVDSVSDGGR